MASADPIIRDLEIMAAAVNYRRWIASQFHRFLGQRIVECGAGIGTFTELWLDRELVLAVDAYEPCVERLRSRFAGFANVVPIHMDIASPTFVELARYRPDTIVCLNVLEHVEHDLAALSMMFTLLPRGGRLVIFVPAFQGLYGSIDRLIGHHRRYAKRELREKLTQTGFTILDLLFMNGIAPVGWWWNNRVMKRNEESPLQVMVFDRWVVPWLSKLERLWPPPFGLSLIALAEKPAATAAPTATSR